MASPGDQDPSRHDVKRLMPCFSRPLDGQLIGVISLPACPTPTVCCPLACLAVTTGLCLGFLLFGSGWPLLPMGCLCGCFLRF
jgi:hypothetical protein